MNGLVPDIPVVGPYETPEDGSTIESINQRVDEVFVKVDQLEHKMNEVEQFYSTTNKKQPNTPKGSTAANKDREKLLSGFKKRQQDAVRREAAAAKRMQELIRQFGTIIRQITQHKWAKPFMQPVDVVGLGLHDYYEVIEKPMDFSTIKNKMEARDGTGYKNVREICSDVRLIFKNAMKYNEEKDDVHVMAKTLLDKFETKWLQLLPKVDEEEKRLKEEEAEMQMDMQLAQEAAYARMARDLSIELDEVDMNLEELRDMVLRKCRRISVEEKKRLSSAMTRLSPDDISKALEIVAQSNPNFEASGEELELNLNEQSDSTLWKLKFFLKDTLKTQLKGFPTAGVTVVANNDENKQNNKNNNNNNNNNNNKRKREICDALVKASQKKNKKFHG